MKVSYLIIASTLFLTLGCSNWSQQIKRHSASLESPNAITVFKASEAPFEINSSLEDLSFVDEASKQSSIERILAFAQENKEALLGSKDASLIFDPESFSNIFIDEEGVGLRLVQAITSEREGKKIYIPVEGAELVINIKNGKISSLNSSLTIPEVSSEITNTASFEDLKNSRDLDHASLFKAIKIHPDEEDQNFAFHAIANAAPAKEDKSFFKKFISKSDLLYHFIKSAAKHPSSKVKLVLAKKSEDSSYEALWHIDSPLRLPIEIYLSADKSKEIKFVKSFSKLTDVKIKIYRGFILKPDLFRIRSKDSLKAYDDKLTEKSKDGKEALVNLAKVVEYFKQGYSWNSYDNKGSPVVATVKMTYSGLKENAAWISAPYNQFVFGKGGENLNNFTGALDVIGHEYFHSVVSGTANLDHGSQHGALNEHLADIFGVGFESEMKKTPYDQMIGEDVIVKNQGSSNPVALRNFLKPEASLSQQALTMKDVNKYFPSSCKPTEENDSCGVHYSNGVLNKAVGKFIQSYGWDKTKKMIFNVVSKRLRSSSDFVDYREQMLSECQDRFTKDAVECKTLDKNFSDLGLVMKKTEPIKQEALNTCETIKEACKILKDNGIENDICKKCNY